MVASLAVRHRAVGLKIDSFSKLHHRLSSDVTKPEAAPVHPDAVPQGAAAGVQIHALIERVPLESVRSGQTFDAWRERADIGRLFNDWWSHSRWRPEQRSAAEQMAFAALHTPIVLPDGTPVPGLGSVAGFHREVPFHFPFPEATPFGQTVQGPWRIEHGFMTGVIDFAFEHGGRIYFGDWKTNSLADYGADLVQRSVEASYRWQIRIYTLALMRAVGIVTREQYEARFGGVIYVYLRGLSADGRGLFVQGPTPWEELQDLDAVLRDHARAAPAEESEATDADAVRIASETVARDDDESDHDGAEAA